MIVSHRFTPALVSSIIIPLTLIACAPKVLVPPAVDLKQYGRIGVCQFKSNAEGKLKTFATSRFIEAMHEAQPGTMIVDLGTLDPYLTPDGIKMMKNANGIDALIVGNLDVSKVKPHVNLSTIMQSLSVHADIDATLAVKMFETTGGAMIWSKSGYNSTTVANVSISTRGIGHFDATDPENAYGGLIYPLINYTTQDFYSYWK